MRSSIVLLGARETESLIKNAGFAMAPVQFGYARVQWSTNRSYRRAAFSAAARFSAVPDALLALVELLPLEEEKTLVFEHFSWEFPAIDRGFALFLDKRELSLNLSPGSSLHFPSVESYARDQFEISEKQREVYGTLISALSLLLFYSCDSKLISGSSSDFIETWEGNIIFCSVDDGKVRKALETGLSCGLLEGLK